MRISYILQGASTKNRVGSGFRIYTSGANKNRVGLGFKICSSGGFQEESDWFRV